MPQRERGQSHTLLHAIRGELHWRLNSCKAAAAAVGYAGLGVVLLMARWLIKPSAVETGNQQPASASWRRKATSAGAASWAGAFFQTHSIVRRSL